MFVIIYKAHLWWFKELMTSTQKMSAAFEHGGILGKDYVTINSLPTRKQDLKTIIFDLSYGRKL